VNHLFVTVISGLLTAAISYASKPVSVDIGPAPRHNLTLGVPQIIAGQVSLKYEYLFDQRNGIVIGGGYGDWTATRGYVFNLAYRRHRSDTMAGGFWGIFSQIADYESEFKERVDDVTTLLPYTMTSFTVGPYIGHTWITGNGVSIVARLGYGYPFTDFTWTNDKPSEHPDMVEGLIQFFEGIDGELSIGICF
jgi:hypothetical protein